MIYKRSSFLCNAKITKNVCFKIKPITIIVEKKIPVKAMFFKKKKSQITNSNPIVYRELKIKNPSVLNQD